MIGPPIPPEAGAFPEDDHESASSAAIRGLLVDFCGRFLTYEVTTRVFRLCDRLDLGTEFSLSRGRPAIWAAAIAHAIAQVNVLFDSDAPFRVSAADIHAFFGTKPDTVRRKASRIRHRLGIDFGHPDYCKSDIVMKTGAEKSTRGSRASNSAPRRPPFRDGSRQHESGKLPSRIIGPGRQMGLFDD